jgi:hypothetical protein
VARAIPLSPAFPRPGHVLELTSAGDKKTIARATAGVIN